MWYVVAILCPPLAVLAAGKVFQFLVNVAICCTVVGIPFAMLHAVAVADGHYRDIRRFGA